MTADLSLPPTAVQHERGPRKSKAKDGAMAGLGMMHGDHFPVQDASKGPPLLFPPPPLPSLKPHGAPHMFPDGILAPTPILMPHVPTSQPHSLLHMLSAEKLQVRKRGKEVRGYIARWVRR